MTINEWAGIIALPIAIVNLGITIYKEFLKKPKLQLEIILSKWIPRQQGVIDFQFNVRLKAIYGDVHIRNVLLVNRRHQLHSLALVAPPNFTTVYATEQEEGCYYQLSYANEHVKTDITESESSNFMEKLAALKDQGVREIEELKVQSDSVEILTFAGRIVGTISSEWMTRRDIPNESWFLQINYDQGKRITHRIR